MRWESERAGRKGERDRTRRERARAAERKRTGPGARETSRKKKKKMKRERRLFIVCTPTTTGVCIRVCVRVCVKIGDRNGCVGGSGGVFIAVSAAEAVGRGHDGLLLLLLLLFIMRYAYTYPNLGAMGCRSPIMALTCLLVLS